MKKILVILTAIAILMSLAACGATETKKDGEAANSKATSAYTEEVSLGNITYRIIPTWHSEHKDGDHAYFVGEYKNLNDGIIIMRYLPVEEILERDLKDTEKLNYLFNSLLDGQEVENKKDTTVAGCPAIEFFTDEESSDGILKMKCLVFVVPGGIHTIAASSLEKLNSELETAYDGLLETITYTNNAKIESDNTSDSEESKESNNKEIRPEFKEAMDAYEAFYDEYCKFMAEYKKNPTDLSLLGKYTEMLTKLDEMNKAFEAWDEDEMSTAELKYYLDVNNRVTQKMIDVVG